MNESAISVEFAPAESEQSDVLPGDNVQFAARFIETMQLSARVLSLHEDGADVLVLDLESDKPVVTRIPFDCIAMVQKEH